VLPHWSTVYTPLRWWTGCRRQLEDRCLGRWAAAHVKECRPDACYVFTQVGLETLRWARHAGVPTVLDSPNGHLGNFRSVYCRESAAWCGARYLGHPTEATVRRVEEEYVLADRIRVSSAWAKKSLAAHGISAAKIDVVPQPIDLARFRPAPRPVENSGPLRVCFVGNLDLRKGFAYLLRAARHLGNRRMEMRLVGNTGDRDCRRLLARESQGLRVSITPGDPLPAYHWADLLVLPSLEDGFGFVVAEAMACGLPAIVTDCCGAAELIEAGANGWIVPAADAAALAATLEEADRRRIELAEMGRRARAAVEAYSQRADRNYFRRAFLPTAAAQHSA
jgi:glycosyltransferase involved in cell wall biosynthesis